MIVFFVSECEKKARKRTVQVLDSFAERIGHSTWKARMTMEGLKSVKILLSKTASRHTSVACHRIIGHTGTKLVWIVGNRKKFNRHGIVSTNYTRNDALGLVDNDWHYLELIKICTALAGLFHDWGKAWDAFQNMLSTGSRNDHIRHEYVSLLLWVSFVRSRAPEKWLAELADTSKMEAQKIIEYAQTAVHERSLFSGLRDNLSQMIGWLIISHHLQPEFPKHETPPCRRPEELLRQVIVNHGYSKNIEQQADLDFSAGLPCSSEAWCRQAKKWAARALNQMKIMDLESLKWNSIFRPLAHLSWTALMIGDHEASRKAEEQEEGKNQGKPRHTGSNPACRLIAKSEKNGKKSAPVFLDNHLVDVTAEALSFCHLFPYIENRLGYVESAESIERRSTGMFAWQDQAADYVRKKITEAGRGAQGFLGLNMASTGTGKTFANGKIMNAVQGGAMRYTLALGLRSLTLQTGDEYRHRIGLDETEMAVVIGSKAVRELHEIHKDDPDDQSEKWDLYSDWDEISYSSQVLDEKLSSKLSSPNARKILYSPILVCTIDHVIGATEETKRGRHILPWLRMLSSDLVIDEVDDFDGNDLAAIMRLVHLAGMLGRNVMLSSATIPPAVAEAAYNSYSSGWRLFAETRGRHDSVLTVWMDETTGARIYSPENEEEFRAAHQKYIQSRITKLRRQPVKRKTEIRDIEEKAFGKTAIKAALDLHHRHCCRYGDKDISFGIIRMANIAPCVAMARCLLTAELPCDTEIRILPYHSRFPRVTRHFIESELDAVLNRKDPRKTFETSEIRKHLGAIKAANVLFVVIATPIEELGRDHDFDWAVLEPSSIRSLIQMAGRVLRHRQVRKLSDPNLILMNHNVNSLMNRKIAYTRPGYESSLFPLASHDLREILDENAIGESTDSSLRIARVKKPRPTQNLLDLEHFSLDNLLIKGDESDCSSVPGWNRGPWHLANSAQKHRPFRGGSREERFYLLPEEPDYRLKFYQKDQEGIMHPCDEWVDHVFLPAQEEKRLWMPVEYVNQLEAIGEKLDLTIMQAARRFGEIGVPDYISEPGGTRPKFNPHLGLWQDKDFGNLFE